MSAKVLYNKFCFVSTTVLLILFFNFILFKDSFLENEYSFYLFNEIRTIDSNYYFLIKILNIVSIIVSYSFFFYSLYSKIFSNNSKKFSNITNINNMVIDKHSLSLGTNLETNLPAIIPEKGLYQNILITGTIGTRKNFFGYVSFC